MRRQVFRLIGLVLCLMVVWPEAGRAEKPPTGGGQPVLMVDGAWRPNPGSWGSYRIHNRKDNTEATMQFAVLQRTRVDGKPALWMEIAVKMDGQPEAITRILAEDLPAGPGRILKVIVQPKGYPPFIVPESMLEQDGPEKDFQRVGSADKVRQIHFRLQGRGLTGWEVQGKDDQGRPVYATVSQDVPPLGLLSASTAEAEINLLDFGQGATTRIKGDPMNFYLWLTEQMVNGLSQD